MVDEECIVCTVVSQKAHLRQKQALVLAIIKLCLSTAVSHKKFHSNVLKEFWVDLKACLDLPMLPHRPLRKLRLILD